MILFLMIKCFHLSHVMSPSAAQGRNCICYCKHFIHKHLQHKSWTFLMQRIKRYPFPFISMAVAPMPLFTGSFCAHKQQTLTHTHSHAALKCSLRTANWCFSFRCLNRLSVADCRSIYVAYVESLALTASKLRQTVSWREKLLKWIEYVEGLFVQFITCQSEIQRETWWRQESHLAFNSAAVGLWFLDVG